MYTIRRQYLENQPRDLWKTSGFQQFNVLQKFSPEFLTLEEEGINVMLIRLFILDDPVQICR